jgi:hypothetical protein
MCQNRVVHVLFVIGKLPIVESTVDFVLDGIGISESGYVRSVGTG